MTRSAELRNLASGLAAEFRMTSKPHEVAGRLVDGTFARSPEELAYLVAAMMDHLDQGQHADLLSQLRVRIPR